MSLLKKICLVSATITLVTITISSFILVLVLGAIGIESANDDCTAIETNSTQRCMVESDLRSALGINGSLNSTHKELLERHRTVIVEHRFWLAGASVSGLVWAVAMTLTAWLLVSGIKKMIEMEIQEEKKKEGDEDSTDGDIELREVVAGVAKVEQASKKIIDDVIGEKYTLHEWETTTIHALEPLSILTLFWSFLNFICALLCLMWAIAISYDNARRVTAQIEVYIIVELLAALALPIFLFMSVFSIAIVIDYITAGRVDVRKGIERFLPVVKFAEGGKYDYWVIEDVFYFAITKREDRFKKVSEKTRNYLRKTCCFSIDYKPATWFLAVIVCVSVHLAISYFVDITLDEQVTVGDCDDTRIDRSYDCFHSGSLEYLDCVTELAQNGTSIHCFKFFRFGVDVNLVGALGTSFAFYLATIGVFGAIFSVVKILLQIKQTRGWGIGFLLLGVVCLLVAIAVIFFWITGYAVPVVHVPLRINIINIAQFLMVAVFLLMVGLLLIVGRWYERKKKSIEERIHLKGPGKLTKSQEVDEKELEPAISIQV